MYSIIVQSLEIMITPSAAQHASRDAFPHTYWLSTVKLAILWLRKISQFSHYKT